MLHHDMPHHTNQPRRTLGLPDSAIDPLHASQWSWRASLSPSHEFVTIAVGCLTAAVGCLTAASDAPRFGGQVGSYSTAIPPTMPFQS
jgi:hypothetical protein